ncbi:MAG: hypothetical protein WBP41_16145 [Saprospiraceae bacterium]
MKSLRLTYLIISILSIALLILSQNQNTDQGISYSSAYTFIPLLGGILGIIKFHLSSERKQYQPTLTIAGTFFSFALIFWAIGSMIWTYFYMNKYLEPPYPSVADLFYSSHGICWMIGILYILRKMKANLLSDFQKISPYIILLLVNSYILLFQGNTVELLLKNGDPREFARYLLNLLYTLVDIANLCLLMICVFGKFFKRISKALQITFVLISTGLFINYVANLIFGIQQGLTYQHPIAKFIGAFVDYLYAIEFIFLAMAILNIPPSNKMKESQISDT